jgi:hypothetical protein
MAESLSGGSLLVRIADMIPVVTATVLPLSYATAQTLKSAQVYSTFRLLLILAILSGLCVGVCFITLWGDMEAPVVIPHLAVFGATLFIAMRGGLRLAQSRDLPDDPSRVVRTVLDCLAGAGLVMIGVAPSVYMLAQNYGIQLDETASAGLGVAYLLLGATTARHVMLYRFLARVCRQVNRHGMAKSLVTLGWVKAIYEGLWLICCAAALLLIAAEDSAANLSIDAGDYAIFFAVAGLFGAMGFAGVWIWMVISHALLMRLAK